MNTFLLYMNVPEKINIKLIYELIYIINLYTLNS